MFSFLSKLFRVKKREIEANLQPTPACQFGGKGEVEIETWSDGSSKIEAEIKNTGLPDGTKLDVVCAGSTLLTLAVSGGYAKVESVVTAEKGLPEIKVGDSAEFRSDNQVLYRGMFRPD